ncbi:hypothetical protein K525DRAFT_275846 [Schizophyllum commune Loenen D]|nr:hypothetical protein K525DRAFT_275846 [Schizophyllum commune Loenen D]
MAIKRSSLPDQVNYTAQLSRHPFKSQALGHHDYMHQIYANELSGGASITDVENLATVLFPEQEFPPKMKPNDLLDICVAARLTTFG